MEAAIRRSRRARISLLLSSAVLAGLTLAAAPANALVIKATFDSSVTSSPYASLIKSDFAKAEATYEKAFSTPATVNVEVGWGAVDGKALRGGALGTTLDNLYGYFNYSQIAGYLKADAKSNSADTAIKAAASSLPSSIAGEQDFAVPYSEAKALGIMPATMPGEDAYIGFSSTAAFDFNPLNGITANTYDFQATATHELAHALGRISGLQTSAPIYRTPLDLYRYTAAGRLGFSYNQRAYFSLNGGKTDLGDFNYSGAGLDRDGWLLATTGKKDLQVPTSAKGMNLDLSVVDLTVLDALGWGGSNVGNTRLSSPTLVAQSMMDAAPEPGVWLLLTFGVGLIGMQMRRQQKAMAGAAAAPGC